MLKPLKYAAKVLTISVILLVAGCGGETAATQGEITEAQMKQAYETAADCIRAEGWDAQVHPGGGSFQITVSSSANLSQDELLEKTGQLMDDCTAQHVGSLENDFRRQNVPQGEEREKGFAKFQECVKTNGILPDDIWLGQPQAEMITALQELNGMTADWPDSLYNCVQYHYDTLWPESIPE